VVRNVHERLVSAPIEVVGPLLDRLGGPDDVLWPSPAWVPMVLDGPVAVGSAGGHGSVRYRVVGHEPGRAVTFELDPGQPFSGGQTVTAEPAGPGRTLLRHALDWRLSGPTFLAWSLVIRRVHDAVVEEMFDNAERAVGHEPARPARRSPRVRLVRALGAPRARPVAPPHTALLERTLLERTLLEGALPRVDRSDAHSVETLRGMPHDPQVWADAVFRDPPSWVVSALGLRKRLLGLVGIERSEPGAFETLARTDDEVLLGADANHRNFRASVRREQDRVVLTTVVQVHNGRGRAYFAPVRMVHPTIVRAMLNRASRRLSSSSGRRGPAAPTVGS
jgi:hypothetical protein